VEQLACIFEMFGTIHMISHEHRREETTNGGMSASGRCGGSYFPVWCGSVEVSFLKLPRKFRVVLQRAPGASGKNVVWTVFPFAPQRFIRGNWTLVVR
jgi:hypothetical protein